MWYCYHFDFLMNLKEMLKFLLLSNLVLQYYVTQLKHSNVHINLIEQNEINEWSVKQNMK